MSRLGAAGGRLHYCRSQRDQYNGGITLGSADSIKKAAGLGSYQAKTNSTSARPDSLSSHQQNRHGAGQQADTGWHVYTAVQVVVEGFDADSRSGGGQDNGCAFGQQEYGQQNTSQEM